MAGDFNSSLASQRRSPPVDFHASTSPRLCIGLALILSQPRPAKASQRASQPASKRASKRAAWRAHSPSLLTAILSLVLVFGCGYRSVLGPAPAEFAGAREPGEQTRIVVLALTNDSPEPWLDRIVTDAMRREMSARGGFRLVDERSDAELMLRGRVRPLNIRSKSFSGFVAALEYELTVALDLELVLESGQAIRLDPRVLSESDVYLASADIEVTRSNRLETIRRLSDLLSSRVADLIELVQRPLPADAPEAEPTLESGPGLEERG